MLSTISCIHYIATSLSLIYRFVYIYIYSHIYMNVIYIHIYQDIRQSHIYTYCTIQNNWMIQLSFFPLIQLLIKLPLYELPDCLPSNSPTLWEAINLETVDIAYHFLQLFQSIIVIEFFLPPCFTFFMYTYTPFSLPFYLFKQKPLLSPMSQRILWKRMGLQQVLLFVSFVVSYLVFPF